MNDYRYICIEGNIGAGKTTLATILAGITGRKLILETFEENPYLPLFYQDPERYALQTELTFLTDRYKQLSTEPARPDLFQPEVIADYFLFKSRLFASNNLSAIDFRLYTKIFSIIEAALPKPSVLVYLHYDPTVLLQRIRNRGRVYEQHISAEYLNKIQNAYFAYLKSEVRFPVILLDMENQTRQEPEQIAKSLLKHLEIRLINGINRF
jgi:deoxyguanosine kinase